MSNRNSEKTHSTVFLSSQIVSTSYLISLSYFSCPSLSCKFRPKVKASLNETWVRLDHATLLMQHLESIVPKSSLKWSTNIFRFLNGWLSIIINLSSQQAGTYSSWRVSCLLGRLVGLSWKNNMANDANGLRDRVGLLCTNSPLPRCWHSRATAFGSPSM